MDGDGAGLVKVQVLNPSEEIKSLFSQLSTDEKSRLLKDLLGYQGSNVAFGSQIVFQVNGVADLSQFGEVLKAMADHISKLSS